MAIPVVSFGQELVVNGGFEASATTPTGWTVTNLGSFTGVNTPGGQTPHGGTNWFGFGSTTEANQTDMEQTLATVIGQQYTVSWWGYDMDPASPGGFNVTFNGITVGARPASGLPYQNFSAVITATSSSTVLRVRGWELNQWIIADDFSVQAVPEPATFAVLGLGAAALLRRRRARK